MSLKESSDSESSFEEGLVEVFAGIVVVETTVGSDEDESEGEVLFEGVVGFAESEEEVDGPKLAF